MAGLLPGEQGSVNCLSDDVLTMILARVNVEDSNETLLCGEVCRQWNRAIKPAISSLTLSLHSSPVLALGKVARFENLQCLRIERCTFGLKGWASGFEAVGKSCRHLSALHAIDLGFRGSQGMDFEDVASLFTYCCNLRILELRSSVSSNKLPSLVNLKALESLDISNNCWLQTLPPLDHLSALLSLNLSQCRKLKCLPSLFSLTSLQTLDISFCSTLRAMPPLKNFPSLLSLNASGSPWLRQLNLADAPGLRHLNVRGCEYLCHVAGLSRATQIQSLSLPQLEQHQSLALLSELQTLTVSFHDADTDLCFLTTLTALKDLTISRFRSCVFPPGAVFPTLKTVVFEHPSFVKVPNIQFMRKLQTLQIRNSESIQSMDALEVMPMLSRLHVSHCPRLLTLADHLPSLTDLSLAHCERLVRLPSFDFPCPLTQLILLRCDSLREMPSLMGLSCLFNLRIVGCILLAKLPSLSHLTSLHSLTVISCRSLRELPILPQSLCALTLKRCMTLVTLPSLAGLIHLRVIDIDECCMLQKLPDMQGLTALKELHVKRCNEILALPCLADLLSLRKLDLSGCDQIGFLPPLYGLHSLRSVILKGCHRITNVPLCDSRALKFILDE